jgi:hypothetical protein
MTVLLEPPVQRWVCPNCNATDTTRGMPNRFHPCPGIGGLTAPLVLAGTDCRVVAVMREDYVGGELVQVDDRNRPVMAVLTLRPDGSNDVLVNAPTARGTGA